jgi:tripartite-type tricarboxylate transporter receptor subunit TctC
MTASIPATLPQAAEKKVRVLAVTGNRRAPLLPDVPSWQEAGVGNANVINYWGIVAPVGTPREIVLRLNAEVQAVLAQPEVRARLEKEGAELIPGPPERLAAVIQADLDGWKKLIADSKLQFE